MWTWTITRGGTCRVKSKRRRKNYIQTKEEMQNRFHLLLRPHFCWYHWFLALWLTIFKFSLFCNLYEQVKQQAEAYERDLSGVGKQSEECEETKAKIPSHKRAQCQYCGKFYQGKNANYCKWRHEEQSCAKNSEKLEYGCSLCPDKTWKSSAGFNKHVDNKHSYEQRKTLYLLIFF